MARIPRYVQDSLASQAVGTPGLDQSANILSNAQQNATNQLAYSDMQNQVSNTQGLGYIAGNAIKAISTGITLQRTLQKGINAGKLAQAKYDFSGQFDESENAAKMANENNPTAASQTFKDDIAGRANKFIFDMEKKKVPREVIAQFTAAVKNEGRARAKSINSWGFTESVKRTKESMALIGKDLPIQLGASRTLDDLVNGQVKVAEYAHDFQAAYMGEDVVKKWAIETSRESARQFLLAQADKNPRAMEAILADERIQRFHLKQTDLTSAQQKAEGEIKKIEAKEKEEFKEAKRDFVASVDQSLMDSDKDINSISLAQDAVNYTKNALRELERIPFKQQTEMEKFQIKTLQDKSEQYQRRLNAAETRKRQEENREKALANAIVAGNNKLVAEMRRQDREEKQKVKDDWIKSVSSGNGLDGAIAAKEAYEFATESDSKITKQERLRRIDEAVAITNANRRYLDPPDTEPKEYATKISALNALRKSVNAKTEDESNIFLRKFQEITGGMFKVNETTQVRLNPTAEAKKAVAIDNAGKDLFSKAVDRAKAKVEGGKLAKWQLDNLARAQGFTLNENDYKRYMQ